MIGLLIISPFLIFSLIFLGIALRAKVPRLKEDFFPLVTLVAWTWKGGNIIERKIKNFLSLAYPGKKEILIVDNHSKDETQKICERYAKLGLVKFYRTPIDYGRKATGLNEGIRKLAKGEIIAVTDPDGICEPDWLIKIVQPFKDPRVGAVIGLTHCGNWYKNFFTRLMGVEDEWYFITSPLGRRARKDFQLVMGANFAISRKALKDVGYLGEKTLGEDLELTIALYSKDWKVEVADANVWQEEVEDLYQYFRQRTRWQINALGCYCYYKEELRRIRRKRKFGLFLWETASLVPLFSFIYAFLAFLGLTLGIQAFLLGGLICFLNLSLALSIGLARFKRFELIPYVPLYLLIQPILSFACWLIIFYTRVLGGEIIWKPLYNGYYHAGTEIRPVI
jgi:cellulose synthase/poly-beta-1,6-N-acetylglucosamine synthase-like glycosyltransferase